jgi:hypothetical protein
MSYSLEKKREAVCAMLSSRSGVTHVGEKLLEHLDSHNQWIRRVPIKGRISYDSVDFLQTITNDYESDVVN